METTVLEIAARSAGVLPSAVEDAVRRLDQHFASQADPNPEMVSQQLALLRESAPHLFPRAEAQSASGVPPGVPPEVWAKMTPESRLGWWYAHHPRAPVQRRPPHLEVSPEQARAFAAMPVHERLTAFRKMQQEGGQS